MWIVWSVVGLYVVVGVYLVSKGPLGQWIDQRLKDTWFDFELDAWIAEGSGERRASPVEARLGKLGMTFRALAVLVWPLLLPGALRKPPAAREVVSAAQPAPAPEAAPMAVPAPPPKPLTFKWLSGTGEITCLACGYQAPLSGSLHFRNPDTHGSILHLGHQCQSCHKFCKVIRREGVTPILQCECGGELAREAPLVCPSCASQHLGYECFLMT